MLSNTAKYIAAVTITCAVIVYFEFETNENEFTAAQKQNNTSPPIHSQPSPAPALETQNDGRIEDLIAEISLTDEQLEQEVVGLLRDGEFRRARAHLMQLAADAVEKSDKHQLGHIMILLGQVAIEEQDLDNAEVYLLEALDVYDGLGDQTGTANVYVQLGKSHLKSRHMARVAGRAYDRLLIARWQLSRGFYQDAKNNLLHTINDNLAINRFGAAASAYTTLVELYRQQNNTYQAELAAAESAELFAASGQLRRAKQVLDDLEQIGVEPNLLIDLETSIIRNYAEFNANIEQIERAKDYERLYNHYKAKGDTRRAWRLRVQADQSLANVSKRAMYHRQPDVLAVLHNSNNDMERAGTYLKQAENIFDVAGLIESSTESQALARQIY